MRIEHMYCIPMDIDNTGKNVRFFLRESVSIHQDKFLINHKYGNRKDLDNKTSFYGNSVPQNPYNIYLLIYVSFRIIIFGEYTI